MFLSKYHYEFTLFWIFLAFLTLLILRYIKAPYGRHERSGWGIMISTRSGWMIMESLPAIFFPILLFYGSNKEPVVVLFCTLWTIHYVNRALVWPNRAKLKNKKIPLIIVVIAMIFNIINSYVNGLWIFELTPRYTNSWFYDLRFIFGMIVFFFGMILNISSDEILFKLRDDGSIDYKIPKGGWFEKVSCPNYLGEIIEWIGWAIATWSLAGLSFAIWTFCNLAPRALSHHRWYQEKFVDYPKERKAVIPYIL
tara:strand:- start:82964 stop:83722 length:759 start_codon:yes stop_codon:yes gene_type:complete